MVNLAPSQLRASNIIIHALNERHTKMTMFAGAEDPNWLAAYPPMVRILEDIPLEFGHKVCTVPKLSEYFPRRAEELSLLDQFFADSNTQELSVAVVSSEFLGVDCAEFASYYCHHQGRERYEHILWFQCESATEFEKSCVDNARKLGLICECESSRDKAAFTALVTWLSRGERISDVARKKRRCLIVFDSCQADNFVNQLFPSPTNFSHIILTTHGRELLFRTLSRRLNISINPLSPTESVSFFRSVLKGERYRPEISDDLITSIAHTCDYLPLQLKIVAQHFATKTRAGIVHLSKEDVMDIITLSPSPSYAPDISSVDLDANARHLLRLLSMLDSQGVVDAPWMPDTNETPKYK